MFKERRNDKREYSLSDDAAAQLNSDTAVVRLPEIPVDMVNLSHEVLMRESNYTEIEKTESQEEIAHVIIAAIQKTLSELGFDWAHAEETLCLEHIHIISDDTFYTTGVHPEWAAFHVNDGSIYISEKAASNSVSFITTLAHEMAHEVSYQEFGKLLQFTHPKKTTRMFADEMGPDSKSGIATRHGDTEYFRGYMEAVNELLSVEFCKRVFSSGVVPKNVKRDIVHPRAYLEQIFVLETIIEQAVVQEQRMSGNNNVDAIRRAIMNEIFSDHIAGTYQFLDRLSRFWPKAIEALEEMSDTEIDSVIQIAEMLNLTNVADKIAEYHNRQVIRS